MPPLKKNEKVMLVIIGIALVGYVIMDPSYFIWKDPPVDESAPPPVEEQPVAKGAEASQAEGGMHAGQRRWGATVARERVPMDGWERDPFIRTRPYLDEVWKLSDMKLGAISVRGKDRFVLINSRVLRVGDEIGGMTIGRIERDRVILSTGARNYTLTWEK